MNLKAKYILSFLIIYLIAAALLTIYLTDKNQKMLINQVNSSFQNFLLVIGRSIASPLTSYKIVKMDEQSIKDVRREIFEAKDKEKKFEELLDIIIFDKEGKIAFPDNISEINKKFPFEITEEGKLSYRIINFFNEKNNFYSFEFKKGINNLGLLVYRVPFTWSGGVVYPGYVATLISYDKFYQEQNKLRINSLIVNLLFLSIAIVLIWLITLLLTKRIYIIVGAVKNLSQGKFTKIPPSGKDELEALMKEFNNMIDAIKERQLLGTYVSESTLEMVKKSAQLSAIIEPSYQEYTVFFSDIRGFTSFSEKHDPKEVMSLLNKLLDFQVNIIKKYNGDIDKFIGDSVMAIFKGDNKEINAVKAAYEIQKTWPVDNVFIGIGISTGKLIVGNIGSQERKEAAAIGDIVNTASRLCSHAKPKEIVLCENTYKIANINEFEGPEMISVKGKSQPISVYKKKI
ncbi:MAG: adenylate/guanylate cyclase domain-containing protein [Exilispira sp.]